MIGYSNEHGNVIYADEVISKIVGLATMECYGVVGMVSKSATEGLWELMRIENLAKGVKIEHKDEKLIIELLLWLSMEQKYLLYQIT